MDNELGEKPIQKWAQLAADGNISDAVIEYVRRNDYVSFPELVRHFEPYLETRGTQCITIAPHLLLWAGVSEQFADILCTLLNEEKLHLHPASIWVYLADGGFLTLPIPKRRPRDGFKQDYWLPTVLRLVPFTGRRAAKGIVKTRELR